MWQNEWIIDQNFDGQEIRKEQLLSELKECGDNMKIYQKVLKVNEQTLQVRTRYVLLVSAMFVVT